MAARVPFFATCAPGVEPLLHAEVRELGLGRVERQVGGVYFEGTLRDAWRANLHLRTAIRVLQRVARFPCADEAELYDGVGGVDWGGFLRPEGTLVVDAHVNDSALTHSRFVEQRTKDAVVDQIRSRTGTRPSVGREDADLGIHVHLFRDRCTLLVDTSGGSLHRRGWRVAQGRAPLSETLAAAVVLATGWDRRSPFLDPFCGSGTLLVEALHLADGVAPGLRRSFGFERWPGHDERAWARLRDEARQAERPVSKLQVRGFDRDPERLDEARANLESAGLAERVVLEEAEALDFAPRSGWNGHVVSNLPYGERVNRGEDVEGLYRAFGERLRSRCAGYRVGLLGPAGRLSRAFGLADAERLALKNGGLDCILTKAEIHA